MHQQCCSSSVRLSMILPDKHISSRVHHPHDAFNSWCCFKNENKTAVHITNSSLLFWNLLSVDNTHLVSKGTIDIDFDTISDYFTAGRQTPDKNASAWRQELCQWVRHRQREMMMSCFNSNHSVRNNNCSFTQNLNNINFCGLIFCLKRVLKW